MMNPEKKDLLFKEKKLSRNITLSLYFLAGISVFLLSTLLMYSQTYPISVAIHSGFIIFLGTSPIFLMIGLNRTEPLEIYENGFKEPRRYLKSFKDDSRFIDFDRVKNIYPAYTNSFGAETEIGLEVILKSGKKVKITRMDEKRRDEIKSIFKKALGDRWNEIYIDRPYMGYDEIQEMKNQLNKSKKSVFIGGFGLIVLTFLIQIIFLVFFFDDVTLIVIGTPMTFMLAILGITRIIKYYNARTNYKQLTQHDGSVEDLKSLDIDIDLKEEDSIEDVQDYTWKDWKELEEDIDPAKIEYLMVTGAVFLVTALVIDGIFSFIYHAIVLFSGIGILLSSLLFIPKLTKKTELVKDIVEKELKKNKEILPEHFNINRGFFCFIPFREEPIFSDKKWKRLVRSSKLEDEKYLASYMTLLLASLIAPIAIISVTDLPSDLTYIGLFCFGVFLLYFLLITKWMKELRQVQKFEELTGKKVIPKKYRDMIHDT